MRFAINGIVLKEKETGENDKLLLVLTAERGKIWVCAKGGRSIKSAKSAVCRPFTYAELEIYEKHERLWLSGGSPLNSFFAYKPNLKGYSLAAYIAEICEEITVEGEGDYNENLNILRATLNAFFAIEKELYPFSQIKSAYELFAASVSGFSPDLYGCLRCNCEINQDTQGLWLDVMNGGIVCGKCLSKSSTAELLGELDAYETRNILLPLDLPSLMAMRYCILAPVNRLFNFSIKSGESDSRFAKAAESYLLNHLERGFETLNFYNSIKD